MQSKTTTQFISLNSVYVALQHEGKLILNNFT